MKPIVLGLCGLAGSGKSTAAQYLVDAHGFVRVPMAGALKKMAAAILSPRQMDGDLKEVPCEILGGYTPRQFMQKLGTEFGREMISPTLWIDLWRARVSELHSKNSIPPHIVVDDIRFPNEVEMLRSAGGVLYKIERPGSGSATGGGHASEKMDFKADGLIRNDTNIDAFLDLIDRTVFGMGVSDE